MTIADMIRDEVSAMPANKQRLALSLVRQLQQKKTTRKRPVTQTSSVKNPALRAVAGIWADRKDLPAKGGEASLVLRKRALKRTSRG